MVRASSSVRENDKRHKTPLKRQKRLIFQPPPQKKDPLPNSPQVCIPLSNKMKTACLGDKMVDVQTPSNKKTSQQLVSSESSCIVHGAPPNTSTMHDGENQKHGNIVL